MSFKDAAKTTGLIFLSLAGIILLYSAINAVTDELDEAGYSGLAILSNTCFALFTYFLVRWFNKKVNGLTVHDYGFTSRGILRNLLLGTGVAALLVSLTLLLTFFYRGSYPSLVNLKNDNILAPVEFILANMVVAVWEEMYFRGLVFNTLIRRKTGFTRAAILSSALFTVLHFASYDLSTITPLWMAGVFFISSILLLLYVFTRSIWTAIGCHCCWDTLFMSLDKNENDFGIVQMETYQRDAVLIDNISIFVTGAALVLLLYFGRNRVKALTRSSILTCLV